MLFRSMESAIGTLRELGIRVEAKVTSAHRTPVATHDYVKDAERRGCAVFIAAAGMAAHLAGAVAANTLRPVIGVPIANSLEGLDALLAIADRIDAVRRDRMKAEFLRKAAAVDAKCRSRDRTGSQRHGAGRVMRLRQAAHVPQIGRAHV